MNVRAVRCVDHKACVWIQTGLITATAYQDTEQLLPDANAEVREHLDSHLFHYTPFLVDFVYFYTRGDY